MRTAGPAWISRFVGVRSTRNTFQFVDENIGMMALSPHSPKSNFKKYTWRHMERSFVSLFSSPCTRHRAISWNARIFSAEQTHVASRALRSIIIACLKWYVRVQCSPIPFRVPTTCLPFRSHQLFHKYFFSSPSLFVNVICIERSQFSHRK